MNCAKDLFGYSFNIKMDGVVQCQSVQNVRKK
jgi:hypothetical protein